MKIIFNETKHKEKVMATIYKEKIKLLIKLLEITSNIKLQDRLWDELYKAGQKHNELKYIKDKIEMLVSEKYTTGEINKRNIQL